MEFAAFPEIFDPERPGLLYRYLRKFHSVAERRYVVLCAHHIPAALVVFLSLEFLPRPRHQQERAKQRSA